jgi:hypothetical protein
MRHVFFAHGVVLRNGVKGIFTHLAGESNSALYRFV